MKYTLHYLLTDSLSRELESGRAEAVIDEEQITIAPRPGQAIAISYRDIESISREDYHIEFSLRPDDKLVLSKLGSQFDSFYRNAVSSRNETILRDLLMYESLRKDGYRGLVEYRCDLTPPVEMANCELRLYETALVLLPDSGELIRIPYSFITLIKEDNYSLLIETESGERLAVSKLGRQHDPFFRDLNSAIEQLDLKAQTLLKELAPGQGPLALRKAALLLRDGRAAKKAELDLISTELWSEIENKLVAAGIKEEYDFLRPYTRQDKVAVGLKRGLMGELTGEYIWFMIPVYNLETTGGKTGGNAIAIEAASSEGGVRATYFFQIVSRNEYQTLKASGELENFADQIMLEINRCMLLINFRREPIYITDAQLVEPRFEKYRYAVNKIPSLQLLRERFIGRIFHRSMEQWSEDVRELLRFNVEAGDDSIKWLKKENI